MTAPDVAALTTLRHRYPLRDGREARHVHSVGVERRTQRRLRTVRNLLRVMGITQAEVARRSGVTPQTVSRMLHGRYTVSPAVTAAIVDATGIRWGLIERMVQP